MSTFWTHLFKSVQPESFIITANKRLAEKIIHERPLLRSHTMTVDEFITDCFKRYHNAADIKLLTTQQTYWIWQDIVSELENFFHLPTLAETAQSAWNLMKNWQIPFEKLSSFPIEDTENFLHYAEEFEARCRKNRWIDLAVLKEKIIPWFANNLVDSPKHILLVGFLEHAPLSQKLWKTLKNTQCRIESVNAKAENNRVQTIALPNSNAEITTMARYAISFVKDHPNETIHCIIPNLHEIKYSIEKIFKAVISATSTVPYERLVNMSACSKLTDYSIIQIAFILLRFKTQTLSMSEITRLLLSPFIADNIERFSEYALCDAKIRKIGNTHYSLKDLIYLLETMIHENALLLQCLKRLAETEITQKEFLSKWSIRINQLLALSGWPGKRPQNKDEKQIIDRFQKLLGEEFQSLETVMPPISYSEARKLLEKMAGQTLFQPKTNDIYAPIQLLGLLEALGQPAKHIWMMGIHDRTFPEIPSPNSFIPNAMQREYQLPHANADREWHFSECALNMLKKQCEKLIISYAEKNQDETQLPSVLIQSFEKIELENLRLVDFVPKAERQLGKLTINEPNDDFGIPVQEKTVNGGTDILKLQSLCPFRAYAKHRLKARKLEQPQTGFNTKERGQLMHSALENFWKQVKSQQTLLSMDNNQLKSTIKESIQKAFDMFDRKKRLPKTLIQIEKLRLNTLMNQWLELEKTRKPFTVFTVEHWHQTKIGRLIIKTRIDRIDKIDEGYLLIEYKTGQPKIDSWFGKRLEEPQLPIYAVTAKQPICAIAYGQIHYNAQIFKSVSDIQTILPNNKTFAQLKIEEAEENWQNQLNQWKESLEKLAEDYCRGYAAVDPKESAKTCRHCDYFTLCRIFCDGDH